MKSLSQHINESFVNEEAYDGFKFTDEQRKKLMGKKTYDSEGIYRGDIKWIGTVSEFFKAKQDKNFDSVLSRTSTTGEMRTLKKEFADETIVVVRDDNWHDKLNAKGQEISANGKYSIYLLAENDYSVRLLHSELLSNVKVK